MIMALNSQESFQTRGLHPETVLQLQELVQVNVDSRDAYRAAANLATDSRLTELAQQTAIERHIQAGTLKNILWCNGNESSTRVCGDSGNNRICRNGGNAPPERSLYVLLQELLKIDEHLYASYRTAMNTIEGRGIRQLLGEQATRIQRLRTVLLELQQTVAGPTPSAEAK